MISRETTPEIALEYVKFTTKNEYTPLSISPNFSKSLLLI